MTINSMPCRRLLLALACCASTVALADTAAQKTADAAGAAAVDAACSTVSEAMLDDLGKGDYAAASKAFNADMKKALPAAKLQEAWESLLTNFGPPKLRGEPQGKRDKGLVAIYTPLKFERGNLVSQVACDVDGKVAGFYVVPEVTTKPGQGEPPAKPVEPVQF